MSDEKLIALGTQLEEILERLGPVESLYLRLVHESDDQACQISGFRHGKGPHPAAALDRFLAAKEKMEERVGVAAWGEKYDAVLRELNPVREKIMGTPATSIAGLRVKTLLAMSDNKILWQERELDDDMRAVRSLIEAACALTGVTVPSSFATAEPAGWEDLPAGSAALN